MILSNLNAICQTLTNVVVQVQTNRKFDYQPIWIAGINLGGGFEGHMDTCKLQNKIKDKSSNNKSNLFNRLQITRNSISYCKCTEKTKKQGKKQSDALLTTPGDGHP